MMERTVHLNNESYHVIIPKTLAELSGLKHGDKMIFGMENNKITMTLKKQLTLPIK